MLSLCVGEGSSMMLQPPPIQLTSMPSMILPLSGSFSAGFPLMEPSKQCEDVRWIESLTIVQIKLYPWYVKGFWGPRQKNPRKAPEHGGIQRTQRSSNYLLITTSVSCQVETQSSSERQHLSPPVSLAAVHHIAAVLDEETPALLLAVGLKSGCGWSDEYSCLASGDSAAWKWCEIKCI